MLPRELPIAISDGRLHGGLIPLVDCFPLAESMRTVAGFCVATISQAMSVNVSTVRPLEDMTGARIAVPNEAPTAVKLLQVLLSLRHGVEPAELVSSQDPTMGYCWWVLKASGTGASPESFLTSTIWVKSGTGGPVCHSCSPDL